jgi:hypothetical protein
VTGPLVLRVVHRDRIVKSIVTKRYVTAVRAVGGVPRAQ